MLRNHANLIWIFRDEDITVVIQQETADLLLFNNSTTNTHSRLSRLMLTELNWQFDIILISKYDLKV